MDTAPFRPYVLPSLIPDRVIPRGCLFQRTTFHPPYFIPLSTP